MTKLKYVLLTAVSLALLIFSACGGGSKSSNPDPNVNWETGTVSTYAVSSGSSYTVTDSLTGIDFEFPEGGSGNLSIARIESGPSAPFSGEGFQLNYSGTDPIRASISKEGAYCVLLMGYGTSDGSRDNRTEDDWRAIAESGSTETEAVFELTPKLPSKSGTGYTSISMHDGFSYHWIAKIPAGSNDAVRLAAIKTQANEFISHYLDSLPASIKAAATTQVNGRLAPTFYADDNYYIGFTRRLVIGNSTTPMIGIMPGASVNTVAHEVGHYMNHVLVGDATYLQIEDSAPDNHGVGDLHYKRLSIAEDMAYFGQYFLLGHVNSVDPTEPGLMMRGKDPELTDYPSLEGFACCLLARLNSTNAQIRDVEFTSEQRDFPVIGASFSDILGIIARGATTVDQLRGHIKEYLTGKGQSSIYPIFLERIGWHYIASATIHDEDGNPVSGAQIKCVCKNGSTEYFTRSENIQTDNNGYTNYFEAFPDSSLLRVEYNGNTTDIPIYIDPNGPTNVAVDLGTLEINPFDLSRFHRFFINVYVQGKYINHYNYRDDTEHWTGYSSDVGTYILGSFNGNTFTATWDTSMYANPVNNSGTATITLDPENKRLVSAQTDYIDPASGDYYQYSHHIKIGSISNAERWNEHEIWFRLEGEGACFFLHEFYGRTYSVDDFHWYEITEYECDENSVVEVWLTAY